jgi:two-component system CheB/CheR fusion protein
MMGSSENIGVLKDSMKELSKKWKIYKCIGKNKISDTDQHFAPINASTIIQQNTTKTKNAINNLSEIFKETLLEDYRYAGILIDENMEVKHAIGHFRKFLNFPENNLTFNLLRLVTPDLGVPLGMCIRKAIHEQEKTSMKNLKVIEGNIERTVNIIVKPYLQQQDYQQSFLFVILEEEEAEKKKNIHRSSRKKNDRDHHLTTLEKELRETRENLQSLIEELETSNEELLTSNEEMISANEELQSTNEELQSLNEELHTVSAEHQLKIKELIELNDDLNNYFRNSEIGQILIDKNMVVRKFSPAITRLINLIESDIGRPLIDITNNLKNSDLIADIQKVMFAGEGIKREVLLKDDRIFLMKINSYLRQDGTTDGVVITFVDITETKELSSIIESVFNSSANGITAQKAIRNTSNEIIDFECIAINQAAENMLGIQQGPLNQQLNHTFPLNHDHIDRYIRVVSTGEPDYFQYFNETTNQWYEVVSVKMRDGLVTTFTDITQKKKAADMLAQSYEDLKLTSNKLQETNYRLEQSNMDLLQFASVASHDLKEPLRKIQTFGNMLHSRIEEKLEANEKNYLDKIINASHRMQILIEDVLTLSKLNNTDIPLVKTDLKNVIKRILEDLEIVIREKGTQLQISNLPVIDAVPGQVHQLFQNLISNALKFNESKFPIIKIQERKITQKEAIEFKINPDEFIAICIADNGIGFDEKYRDQIFGIFQRLHNNNIYQGTGIGLAICKKIIDNHHGFIKAESTLGTGSTFTVFLPREQKKNKANNHAIHANPGLSTNINAVVSEQN